MRAKIINGNGYSSAVGRGDPPQKHKVCFSKGRTAAVREAISGTRSERRSCGQLWLSDRPRKSRCASIGGQQRSVRIGVWIDEAFGDIRPATKMAGLMPSLAHCCLNGIFYRGHVARLVSEPVRMIPSRESGTNSGKPKKIILH